MAANALIAQERFTTAAMAIQNPTAAQMNERLAGMVIAAALAHETLVTIGQHHAVFMGLADRADVPEDLKTSVNRLRGGMAAARLLALLRNQLGFHWDSGVVQQGLVSLLDEHDTVVLAESDGTIGETLYRTSSDALLSAIWTEADPVVAAQEGISQLATAMTQIITFIDYVVTGFAISVGGGTRVR